MAISTDDLGRITQQTDVVTGDGDRIGHVHQVYTSDTSGDPAWVTVHTGRFGTQESFVPLSDASFDGDDLRVAVSQEAVQGAPRVDAEGHLSVEEEDDLYRYYGLANPDHSQQDVADAATGTERTEEPGQTDATTVGPAPGVPAGAGAGPAQAGRDRDDDLAARDAEGRDEVVDTAASQDDDASGTGAHPARSDDGGQDPAEGQEAVRPGERTTRLRRYVVTERVVQTVEELPDDDPQ